jgi:Tfp pilus assembly protein PilN
MNLRFGTNKIGGPRGWAAVLPNGATAEVAVVVGTTGVARHLRLPLPEVRTQVNPGEQQIVTAIGGEQVTLQVVALPATDPRELRQMLELQLDTLSPLPTEELVYSYESLAQTATGTRLLVGLARKGAVNERVAALEEQGLPATVVGVDMLAVFRKRHQPADGRLHVLVYVTGTGINVVAYVDEQPLQVRSLMTGDNSQVVDDVRRALLAAQTMSAARELGTVTFLADTEERRATVEELKTEWGSGAIAEVAGSPLATDLCLTTAAQGEARLNLLPGEWRERRRSAGRRQVLLTAAVGIGVLYVLALVGALVLIAWRQSQVRGLAVAVQQQRPAHDATRDLRGTLLAMQAQLDTKYSGLEVLRTISDLLPESVKLTGFNFKKEQNVSLRGQATSAMMANDFISRLEKSALFSNVKTVSVRTEGNLTKFEIIGTLRSPVGKGRTP